MTGDNHQQSDSSTSRSSDAEDVSISESCFRWSYLKTNRGYSKALQMLLSLICFVTTTFASTPHSTWFVAVAISGFTITGILLASHLVGLGEKYPNLAWFETECVCSGILAVCNYVAACSIALSTSITPAPIFAVSAFFSFATIGIYVLDAWLMYRAIAARWRAVESVRNDPVPESISQAITV